eukprot:GFUD01005774.1.p1 GENE.GFUD01005774.1~~GFUD01005774.1.p1  ORF type:complete len:176 (-),score=60.28 GFUD01005774.1:108-635(-)
MAAQDLCENLLSKVKSSNLNFVVRETPYSVCIKVRKSFVKTTNNHNHDLELKLNDEIGNNLQMAAKDLCENLLSKVKSSNLNFVVRETPYSVCIKVRKSFVKTTNNHNHDLLKLNDEIGNNLQNNYDKLKSSYDDLMNKYNDLVEEFEEMKTKMKKENSEKNKLIDRMMKKKYNV